MTVELSCQVLPSAGSPCALIEECAAISTRSRQQCGAMDRLDAGATMDVGLPQCFRGLALAELLPAAGPSGEPPAAQDTWRAEQVTADLEFVLAARD